MDEGLEAARRRLRRLKARQIADQQAGIVSRRQLYDAGWTRWMVKAEVRGGRWRRVGRNLLCVHTGPLSRQSMFWVALLSGGPRAYLDGVSSLQAAGLKGYDESTIRVTVPRGARVYRPRGIDVRQTRRWSWEDLEPGPLRRSRNAIAAIRGGLWARSAKQGALLLTMAVQQQLATPEELGTALLRIKRDKRRAFLQAIILDLLGGVRSIAELDVAGECRRRGLPEPDRQVVRRGRNGKYYLDLYWDLWRVVVEIDGIHHSWASNVVADALRHNDIALDRDVVLRLPVLGLRLEPDAFFAQIESALVGGGWRRSTRRSA